MRKISLVAATALLITVIASPTTVCSAPLFYLSDQPLGLAQPGVFSSTNPISGTTGQLNIYAMTDVRLAGVSLDLLESGGGIKFSGLDVVNDGRWWILDGPQVVEDSKISNIGGGAIPGTSGNGIGPSDFVDANFHSTSGYLLATVDYEVVDASLSSNFELKVGYNTIADWQGDSPMVHFGDLSQPAVPGYPPNLERLPDPLPAQPGPPRDPVPDPFQHPIPLPHRPEVIDPPPPLHLDPAEPDPTIVDGPTDVPHTWNPFVWYPREIHQRPFVWLTHELQQVIDETGVAVEIDYARFYGDWLYFDTSQAGHFSNLHSATNLVTGDGVISGDAFSDNTVLVAASSDGHLVPTVSGLEGALRNGLPVDEYFRETATFGMFDGLAFAGSLQSTPSVPEPATMALSGLTFIALLGLWRRRRG